MEAADGSRVAKGFKCKIAVPNLTPSERSGMLFSLGIRSVFSVPFRWKPEGASPVLACRWKGPPAKEEKFPQVCTEDSAVKRSKLVLSFGRVA